jgi:hypothetical protein
VLAALAAASCGPRGVAERREAPEERGSSGTVGLALRLPAEVAVSTVRFAVSGGVLATPFEGNIDMRGGSEVSAFIGGAPAGNGYRVDLSAVSKDGRTPCSGSTTGVDIKVRMTTRVTVVLSCRPADAAGGGGPLCPQVTLASASALSAPVGSTIALAASGSDLGGGAKLSFAWTATGGTLANPAVANTSFTCPAVGGPQKLTVSVSSGDPACASGTTIEVVCTGGPDGGARPPGTGGGDAGAAEGPARADAAAAADVATSLSPAGADAAAKDVEPYLAPAPEAGTRDLAAPPDARAPAEAGTVTDRCLLCEATNQHPDCAPRYGACVGLAGTAAAGPAAGQRRSTLCLDVLTCVHATRCDAGGALAACLCGPGVDRTACQASAAGLCRSAFHAAAESTDSAVVLARLADPAFAAGTAGLLVTRCEEQPAPGCGFVCGH